MNANIPKTHDFGDSHFAKAHPPTGSWKAKTSKGRGLHAKNRQAEKWMKLVAKGLFPEDSSARTD
jgi:hypothetical protein